MISNNLINSNSHEVPKETNHYAATVLHCVLSFALENEGQTSAVPVVQEA